ncbi:TIGR03747 family integrating conjugative element membrane protein [Pseudomonas sp. MYb185]|uniref:TIGR03747 family integrating conjugative element membrane protein n=1 Tax=Pseudomonas sp. MYb185 TaxID=1848729 RepID=UPI000CFC2761|nr:TIGR03747 family integrating conjugative element membrane protein [Pseudomonas sp. MYb185]PRB81514.1 TIGR03747 family integrating conjugative element membrane protein [Pseudomonas sp. MYb185]
MAEDARVRTAEKKRTGAVSKLFSLPFKVVGVVLVSILISVGIEWAGIYLAWWALPGAEHAEMVMRQEMRWLDTNFSRSLMVSDPVQFAGQALAAVNDWLFIRTGIAGWAHETTSGGWAGAIKQYVMAAMYVTLMTLTRCVILVLTSPLFLLAALVGFVDGLVLRDLRRFGAGRESAFIYHHAKRTVVPVFLIGWLIYLSLPFAIHPNLFLLPCAALFGFLIAVATSTFKKYL